MAKEVEIRKFGNPLKGVENGVIKGNIKIVSDVITQTKLLVAVKTGQTRNSYSWKGYGAEGGFNDSGGEPAPDTISVKPNKNEAYGGSALPNAIYEEFGTRYKKPQPHFRPAIAMVVKGQSAKTVLAKIQEEEMRGVLKKGRSHVQF